MDNEHLKTQEDTANKVIDYITKKGLKSGDRLPSIRRFAEIMGTGMSNLRDGMLQLQAMGLVRISPRAGIFVQSLKSPDSKFLIDVFKNSVGTRFQTDHNLFSLIEAREALEIEIVGRAAARCRQHDLFPLYKALKSMEECRWGDQKKFVIADEDFHLNIAGILGNQPLFIMLEALLTALRPHRMSVVRSPKEMRRISKLHWELYQSIINGNVETARKKIRTHFNYLRQLLVHQVTTIPEGLSNRMQG